MRKLKSMKDCFVSVVIQVYTFTNKTISTQDDKIKDM